MPTYDPTSLIAGDYPLAHRKVSIKSGQNLLRGTVLGRIGANAGAVTVGAPVFSGTGNGVLTKADPAHGAAAQEGTYRILFVSIIPDSGRFEVIRPDGTVDGIAIVGTAYDGQVKFTIADGSTDFSGAAEFTLAVTIADTGADAYVKSLAAATDGSQKPVAVLAHDCDASSGGAKDAPAYVSGEFAAEKLIYGAGHSAASVEAAFRAAGAPLFVRSVGAVA